MDDLEKRGYKVDDSTPLVVIEKPITERAKVVISPIEECSFIWLIDEDAEDKDNEGVRVYFDTDDLDLVEKFAEVLTGVE